MPWEPVIGVEVHAQLDTATKIFCGCAIGRADPPNTRVCPVCLALPGALPVLNNRAVDQAILAALALGCTVHELSVFARKNYFYPDLPKGYQISQFDRPLATGGLFEWASGDARRRVRITRVHLEEDAGKSMHDEAAGEAPTGTLVDFNRCGVPLIEIVTEPDFRSPADAAAFFERLRAVLLEIGVNAGNMEEGNLRCDANVSVRREGEQALGTPVEVKNLNSFRYLQRALEYEVGRQIGLLEAGGKVRRETRLFDVSTGRTEAMRGKEEAHDYRYFPEPDLPPLRIDAARIEGFRAALPELPEPRRERLMAVYGLSEYDARLVSEPAAVCRYFESVVAFGATGKAAVNWVSGELARLAKETGRQPGEFRVTPQALAKLIGLVADGTVSGHVAKDVLSRMWDDGRSAEAIVREEGLGQISDTAALADVVAAVLAAHPKPVAQYHAGRTLTLGFLVGQVMKATGGKANPVIVSDLVRQELDRR